MGADNFEQLGFQVKVDGADSAVSNLDRVIQRLERINQLQGKKVSTSKQVVDAQKEEEKQTKRNTQSLTSYLGKLTSTVVIARKVAHIISSSIQESANYIENLNLFAVAYGEAYQEQLDWALGIAKAYGLANNEVLKFAGTFRELSTSLGLVSDTADLVSETVTNLGYDLAALFNTTVEQAMEKLQSGVFSGNVRPLRAYGIDISQNQIDALFETNEALRQLGVNAKNLSQSDKVLARLIITLQSGKDSFGTMAREINNLQSQFRIFQGSLANFKLAIGDLVNKPLSQAMVYINGFIIAMTNVIRAFVPLNTEDETPKLFSNTTLSAEEASESIDNLNGKLANFDKFNVLQQGEESSSSLAITEELNKLLLEQSEIYKSQLGDLTQIGNKAPEVAKGIISWFIKLDEEGNIVYKDDMPMWTENAKALGDALKYLAIIAGVNLVKHFGTAIISMLNLTNGVAKLNTLLIGSAIYAFVKMAEAIKNGDTGTAILAGTIGVTLVGAIVAFEIAQHKAKLAVDLHNTAIQKQNVFMEVLSLKAGKTALTFQNLAVGVTTAVASFALFDSILKSLEPSAQNTVSIIMIVVGALSTLLGVILAIKGGLKGGLIGASIAGLGVGALIAGIKAQVQENTQGFANGGYTNANLIMTHENGKREWVGKAAGSSAIVNDTQMSDIMEVAVAKGVVLGNRALGNQGSDGSGVIHNHIYLDGKQIYEGVTDTAKKYGKKWATV